MDIVSTNLAPRAIGSYSQAVKAGGFIFCSGQIPLLVDGTMVLGSVKEQTRQVLENLGSVLEAGGSALDRVVKTTVYLTDMAFFQDMNEVYSQFFIQHKPARSTVQVAGLPRGASVEIEVVALA